MMLYRYDVIILDKKIEIEAPYHKLTNWGHITEINLPEDAILSDFMKILEVMKKNDIGCCTISKMKVDN